MTETMVFRDVVCGVLGMGLPLLFAIRAELVRARRAAERLVELGETRERLEHKVLAQRMTEETLSQWWRRQQ